MYIFAWWHSIVKVCILFYTPGKWSLFTVTPSTLSDSTNMVHSKNCTPYFKFISLQSDKEGLLKHIAQQKAFYRVSKQTIEVNALKRCAYFLFLFSR